MAILSWMITVFFPCLSYWRLDTPEDRGKETGGPVARGWGLENLAGNPQPLSKRFTVYR